MQGIASAGGYTYPEGHMPSGSGLDIGRLGAKGTLLKCDEFQSLITAQQGAQEGRGKETPRPLAFSLGIFSETGGEA